MNYTRASIANFVLQRMICKYSTSTGILKDFKSDLAKRIQNKIKHVLTDDQLNEITQQQAEFLAQNIPRITLDNIDKFLAPDIEQKCSQEGLDANEKYFQKCEKTIVREIINATYKAARKSQKKKK